MCNRGATDLDQDRTHNDANEIGTISATPQAVSENYDNFNAATEANTGDGTDPSKDRVTDG